MKKPELLFITNLLPYPQDDGASIKAYNTLRYLSEKYEITLISFIRSKDEWKYNEALKKFCKTIHFVLIKRSRLRDLYYLILSVFSQEPFLIRRDYSPEMQRMITSATDRTDFNIIYTDHLQMAQYINKEADLNRETAQKILDEHNVESDIVMRYFKLEKNPLRKMLFYIEYKKMNSYEVQECKKFDMVLTVSEHDKKRLSEWGVQNVFCIPIGVDTKTFAPIRIHKDSKKITFLGTMYWPPNIDAVKWFYAEIFPHVLKSCPEARLIIIGKKPPLSIQRLAKNHHVEVLGFVDDPIKYLSDCAVFIVPLRVAGGMRVKILCAMAWGLPVVSTTIGAEGIDVINEGDILIRDKPEDFAEAVIRLLTDAHLKIRLSKNARESVQKLYDWDIIFSRMDKELRIFRDK